MKSHAETGNTYVYQSLPSRERGLKCGAYTNGITSNGSLPSRERGLKSFYLDEVLPGDTVAPLAGAWIEIDLSSQN